MSITPIITIAEADVFLAAYADWLALTDAEKTAHIYNASLYIQTNWTCVDVDWTVPADVPTEIKHACAIYTYADSIGNLYGDITIADTRRVSREMVKAGAVTLDTTYTSSGNEANGFKGSYGLADQLMGLYCTRTASTVFGSQTLQRN